MFEREAVLLMFSGGLDSAFLLWWLLTKTNYKVFAHHIRHMTTGEPRWQEEATACSKLEVFCRDNYRDFEYTTSVFDFRGFNYVGWDSDLQVLVASKVIVNLPAQNISAAIGWTKDDAERPIVMDRVERGITRRMWEVCRDSIDNEERRNQIDPNLWFPLIDNNYYKKDIIKECPPEILEMAWTCRRPKRPGIGQPTKPCGNCHACVLLKRSLDKS
jgi:hypothetical protein